MTMKEKALKILRQRIIEGFYEQGAFLQEVLLAEELGMSRTPIREALLILEQEGFVSLTPKKGAMVTNLSVKDIHDIFTVREALELIAIRQAVGKIDKRVLLEIKEKLENDLKFVTEGVTIEDFEFGNRIHNEILFAAGNKYIIKMIETLGYQIKRCINISRRVRSYEEVCKEHLEIVNALIMEDEEKAKDALSRHIRNVMRDILSIETMN